MLFIPPDPPPGPLVLSVLADYYAAQSQQIQQNFEETNAGLAVLRARSELVDALVIRLYQEFISADPQGPRHFFCWRWVVMAGGNCFPIRTLTCFS